MATPDRRLQLDNQHIHQEAFNRSEDAILLLQGETFIDCNPAAVRMLHAADKSEVLNLHPADLSPERQPDGRLSSEKATEMIITALEAHFHRFEWWHRRIDGEEFPCEVTLTTLHVGDETLLHVTWRDLTEEKAAQQQHQLLETAFRQSPDGIAIVGVDGIIRTTNEAWARMHGYSADELPGRHLSLFHTPEQMEREVEPFNQAVAAQGRHSAEVGHVRQNGEVFPTWMTVTLLRDDEGIPIGLIGSAHDISERKVQERRLQESEIRYRTLFELAPNAIATIDLEDGGFVQFNRFAHENLGYTRQEFERLKITDIDIIESSEEVQQHLQKIKQEGHDVFETQHRTKDGRIRNVEVICQLIEIDGRQFNQSVWRDITEQKRSHKALRQEMQRRTSLSRLLEISLESHQQADFLQRFLVELLDLPMMKSRDQGAIFLANETGDQLVLAVEHNLEKYFISHCASVPFGHCLCGRAALQGKPIHSLCCDESRHEIQFPGMESHGHYVIPVVSDGRTQGVINLYLDAGTEYDPMDVDYLSAAADILAGALNRLRIEKKLQQHSLLLEQTVNERTRELAKAAAKAEEANMAKSRFLANMSHELRTPMHAILSFSSMGMQRLNQATLEKLGAYFTYINESGDRLLLLLNGLLDLAKLESDRMSLAYTLSDLQETVNQCTTEQMARLEEQELTLEIIPPTCETRGRFDSQRIGQVIGNLLGNAIKFTPAGRCITITFSNGTLLCGRRKEDQSQCHSLRLSLRDEGIGIPENELETVFDKFIQSSKTRSEGGGTGLGLAISKEIIEAHGGRIWAQNYPQGGAEFILEIPIKGETEAAESASKSDDYTVNER
ncbi:MAG: PAS domain S-box protein [gamma proteobacterium endosymbiont of Lamellibrachia anaximandri]|nr:PAS domain S-box protein [gamma proteobacterium endosymbiont of Lamellibrachia anaximandri]